MPLILPQLTLIQRSPITDRTYNDNYDNPLLIYSQLDLTSHQVAVPPDQLLFESIIGSYKLRNYTTSLTNVYTVWKVGERRGMTNPLFTLPS